MSDLEGDVLAPHLKALLDVESRRPAPEAAVQSRVLKRLELSVFTAASGAAVSVTLSKGGLAGAKLWLLAPFAGLVGVGALVVYLFAGQDGRDGRGAVEPTPKAALVEPVAVVSDPTSAEPTVQTPEAVAVDAGVVWPGPVRVPPAAPKQMPGERLLIETARSGLARHKLNEAEAALAEHLSRFPEGSLAEERDALSVNLLTASGKTREAEQATTAFHARYPNSLLLRQTPWPGGFKR